MAMNVTGYVVVELHRIRQWVRVQRNENNSGIHHAMNNCIKINYFPILFSLAPACEVKLCMHIFIRSICVSILN